MARKFIVLAAISGALAVALGAFGAHAVNARLVANGRLDTYHTAVLYHLVHALALFAAAWVADNHPGTAADWSGWLFLLGEIFFSGSLYLLALFNWTFMGVVAPMGGLAFILGWLCIGWAAWKSG